ncbi:hypothetical protein [Salininema proteolyticum]|uniref:DUF4878 domain-containing protein n=1 Tax=Salininema proteolyticum TaxID=1607685 RepID=A0ABV8TXK3_9ACTN
MSYPPGGGYDPHASQNQPPGQPSYPQSLPPTAPGGYSGGGYASPPGGGYGPPPGGQQFPPAGGPGGQDNRSKLMLVLATIVGLVLVLGIGAIIVVPKWLKDDGGDQQGGGDDTSEQADPDAPSEDEEEPEQEIGGDNEGGWSDFRTKDELQVGSPEYAALQYLIAKADADADAMGEMLCSEPSSYLEFEVEYYEDLDPIAEFDSYETTYFASRDVYGEIQVGYQGLPQGSPLHDEITNVITAVDEDGEWKVCDDKPL